jgi:isopentenyldiphosphate isomerase
MFARLFQHSISKKCVYIGILSTVMVYLFYIYCLDITNNELIDISEDGTLAKNPLDVVSIEHAHLRAKKHRGVWVFVTNEDRQFLFTKRSKSSKTCPGSWALNGEHAIFGETYDHCAHRCVEEELGVHHVEHLIKLEDSPVLVHLDYGDRVDKQWTQVYLAVIKKELVVKEDRYEIDAVQWVNFSVANKWFGECPMGVCRSCNPGHVSKTYPNSSTSFYYTFLDMKIEYLNSAVAIYSNITSNVARS